MRISAEEIDSKKTDRGGWTRETLAEWGVPWPPPPGWRKELIGDDSIKRSPNPHHESCPIAPFAHPLVIQFFAILKAKNLAMTDVAEKAGTSLTCLVKWKRKHTPTIEKFEKAANAVGYELKLVPRDG